MLGVFTADEIVKVDESLLISLAAGLGTRLKEAMFLMHSVAHFADRATEILLRLRHKATRAEISEAIKFQWHKKLFTACWLRKNWH